MTKIRKGNDIEIQWEIYAIQGMDEVPYVLSGKTLTLYLRNQFGKTEVHNFKTDRHILSFVFYGKDQKQIGAYSLELVENDGREGMHTVDECDAFTLVSHSCQAGGESEGRVECIHLQFRSQMTFGSPSSGGVSNVVVDSVLSDTSENPVQNKVVTKAINAKVDKVEGKQLSTEDFTTALKNKLEGLNAFDPTEINNAIKELQDFVNALVNGDATEAIESLNEVLAFLQGIDDTASLEGIVSAILQQIADVRSAIPTKTSDLTNDSGYLTEHQDISGLATKENIAAIQSDINGIKERNTAQDGQIADNKTRIDATATIVGQLSQKIDILNGTGEGSVINTVSTEIAKLIAEAPDALDTLKEIADFIEADATRAAEILTKLDDHESRIAKIEREAGFTVMSEAQYEMLPEKEDKLYFLYED